MAGMELPIDIRHPAWITAVSTVISYTLVLAVLATAFFAVPYLIFSFL